MILEDRLLAKRLGVDVHGSLSLLLAARILERVGEPCREDRPAAVSVTDEVKPPTVAEMRNLSRGRWRS